MSQPIRAFAFVVLLVSLIVTSGCEILGPSVKVEPPRVKVPAVESESPPGQHCPPGQAKKGRC
jgi:hypothetical protein